MSAIDAVVDLKISISNPVQSSANFGTMLIIGPAPADKLVPNVGTPDIGVYSDIKEVTAAGWAAIGENADPVGVAARVAFSQDTAPAEIFIAVQKMGADDALEPITDTLNRAADVPGWYAIAPAGVDEGDYKSIADWAEANGKKIFAYTVASTENPIKVKDYDRTLCIYAQVKDGETTMEENRYAHVAMLAVGGSYTPGTETWDFKTLKGITPAALNSETIRTLEEANIMYYISMGGKNITRNGKTLSGEWVDVIRFCDWLQSDMQARVFNLFSSSPKIPFDDKGIALVENQMIASLKLGNKNGGIADDGYDENDQVIPGFTTSVPRASDITPAQRKERILENCIFEARLTGAIHRTKIRGTLVF